MQLFSFEFSDLVAEIVGRDVSMQLITFEKTCGLHEPALSVDGDANRVNPTA